MGISSSAPVSILADQFQTKSAISAKIVKQNAEAEQNVANLVESSAENLKSLGSSKAPGVGTVVDRRA